MADKIFSLKDKRIVVTGGKGPLGTVLNRIFRESEACVINADVIDDPQDEYYFKGDISDSLHADALIKFAAEKMGGIDALVNAAANSRLHFAEDMSDAEWAITVQTSLYGAFYCCRAALPYLKDSKGAVVNVGSIAALIGLPRGTTHHSAAKAGLIGMTRSLAVEWGKYGIRVNAIAPGQFLSPGMQEMLKNKAYRDDILHHIPLRRVGEIEEIAACIQFLLSDASSYVNGHTLVADGGATIM